MLSLSFCCSKKVRCSLLVLFGFLWEEMRELMGCFVFVFLFFLVSPGCPSPCQDGFFFSFCNLMLLFSSTHIPTNITALELLYHATTGDHWDNNDGWVHYFLLLPSVIFLLIYFFSSKLSGSPCNGTWNGVECHTSNAIDLSLVILCFLISNPSPKITPSNQKKSFSFHSPHLILFSSA